jgi:hypothetical protein
VSGLPLVFDICATTDVGRDDSLILDNLHLVKPISYTEHQCEGIFRSTWTELIVKYMLTFVIGHYPFQISAPLSLCNRSIVSATAGSTFGIEFLGSCGTNDYYS